MLNPCSSSCSCCCIEKVLADCLDVGMYVGVCQVVNAVTGSKCNVRGDLMLWWTQVDAPSVIMDEGGGGDDDESSGMADFDEAEEEMGGVAEFEEEEEP